jgi:small subunit ribosomal protein S15
MSFSQGNLPRVFMTWFRLAACRCFRWGYGKGCCSMAITKEARAKLIVDYKRSETDSGSPEVQVALLTTRINDLTDHFRQHTKDHASRRGLLKMVSNRRRLLDYLKKIDPQRYLDLIKRLDIRK